MKKINQWGYPILLFAFSLILLSCASPLKIADGGVSGTGIIMGRISQFGSIYINGIRFKVNHARFFRDGQAVSGQADFSLGEYVVINGQVNNDGLTGVAKTIHFTDLLEGSVTSVSTDGKTIEILGQKIKTDQQTKYHNVARLTDILEGNIVEVSGIKDASGLIMASSLKLIEQQFVPGKSENELKGTVEKLNKHEKYFFIQNIRINYQAAKQEGFLKKQLENGQYVEVKSHLKMLNHVIIANEIELEEEVFKLPKAIDIKIEGLVTRFVSITDFDVNRQRVTSDALTRYEHGVAAELALNAAVEVEGKINEDGILLATEISFER